MTAEKSPSKAPAKKPAPKTAPSKDVKKKELAAEEVEKKEAPVKKSAVKLAPKIKEEKVKEEEFEADESVDEEEDVVEVSVDPEEYLSGLAMQMIDVLTKMGKLPPTIEEFTFTISSEEDSEVEQSFTVSRDPEDFINTLAQNLTCMPKMSKEERSEYTKKLYKKSARLAKDASYTDSIADQFAQALAFFVINDEDVKYNKTVDRLGKFDALRTVRFSAMALSTDYISKFEAEQKLSEKAGQIAADPV